MKEAEKVETQRQQLVTVQGELDWSKVRVKSKELDTVKREVENLEGEIEKVKEALAAAQVCT